MIPIRNFFLCLGLILFWLPETLYAQVDTGELGKGQGQQVEFENYTGPAARIDTRAQIRGIGYPLGTAVKSGAAKSGAENRYFVIHVVSAPDGNKLDADIFGLGSGVGVDHIRNLRTILQGYLEGAYNYSAQDASLLAEYITIYNAVFRGNWSYFNTIYKRAVLQNLTPEKVGLSTRFSEWPGKTLIVIPLGNNTAGSLSAVNTSSLSDPRVIDEMRKDDGGGVDQRTAMADFKDREADEAEEAARRQREAIAAEEARIAAERAALAAERERIAQERDALNAQELAAREAEAERKAQELAEQEAALEREREAAQQAEDFANQKRAEAEQDRKDLLGADSGEDTDAAQGGDQDPITGEQTGAGGEQQTQGNDGADQSSGEAGDPDQNGDTGAKTVGDQDRSADSQDISTGEDQDDQSGDQNQDTSTRDQDDQSEDQNQDSNTRDQRDQDANTGDQDTNETKPEGDQNAAGADQGGGFIVNEDGQALGIVGMSIAGQNSPFGYFVKVHPSTGQELQRSSLNTINVRSVMFINNRILALAGQNQNGSPMRLIEIDPNTLEVVNQGQDDIGAESLIWVKGNNLYTILSSGGNFYLARFDLNLTLQAKSEVPLHPYAGVNFQGDMLIITQRANGRTLLLDPVDLTEGR